MSEIRPIKWLQHVIKMTSQVVTADGELEILEIRSYSRGYHAYTDTWTPVVGETLQVKREPTNVRDVNAVSLYKEGTIIVGHVPRNLAPRLSAFLRRDVNKAYDEVTGEKLNRGAGYGLEIPCIYRLYGPKAYIFDKMKQLVDSLLAAGHL